jgi:FtsZ-interacting cell division protein ZipA
MVYIVTILSIVAMLAVIYFCLYFLSIWSWRKRQKKIIKKIQTYTTKGKITKKKAKQFLSLTSEKEIRMLTILFPIFSLARKKQEIKALEVEARNLAVAFAKDFPELIERYSN